MIQAAFKLSRSAISFSRPSRLRPTSVLPSIDLSSQSLSSSLSSRLLHDGINSSAANPVTLQMINYALSHARSQKSDESYAQGMLVLEQCLSTQSSDGQSAQDSMGTVLLAMSNLSYERGNFEEAIDKLHRVNDLTQSALGVRVAGMEALVGLHLLLGQDDSSSVLADKCLELLEKDKSKGINGDFEVLSARAKALKGLTELVNGNLESAESFLQALKDSEGCYGSVALSYGEFLHASRNFSLAKEFYQKVIRRMPKNENFNETDSLAVCNMAPDEVLLAATFALGQLESHMGNFVEAEKILTQALTKTEEQFGSHHPKVGVVLTCIGLMFKNKARKERSSSLLIQEGLSRRAIDLLKAPPLEPEGVETKMDRGDIAALARGGYAEGLCVQQNRKAEGEKIKSWAEAAWKNRRMSLAEALNYTETSDGVPVIDARISRVL